MEGANKNEDCLRPSLKAKRVVSSEELFGGQKEIMIIHGESEYRLQITKAGKLILNK